MSFFYSEDYNTYALFIYNRLTCSCFHVFFFVHVSWLSRTQHSFRCHFRVRTTSKWCWCIQKLDDVHSITQQQVLREFVHLLFPQMRLRTAMSDRLHEINFRSNDMYGCIELLSRLLPQSQPQLSPRVLLRSQVGLAVCRGRYVGSDSRRLLFTNMQDSTSNFWN